MTRSEWDQLWWEEFLKLRRGDPTADLTLLHKATTRYMNLKHGERPAAEKEPPGPPWFAKLGALAVGVPMEKLGQIWDLMNGKKTLVGAAITLFAYLVAGLPLVAAMCNTAVCAATVAKIGGIGLTILGLLHKGYKFIYREEHL